MSAPRMLVLLLVAVCAVTTTGCSVDDTPIRRSDTAEAQNVAAAPDHVFTIRVREGEPVPTLGSWKVVEGDVVELRVSTDEEDQLHVHGYDLLRSTHRQYARLRFRADIPGVYEIELEDKGIQIGNLAVYPQ